MGRFEPRIPFIMAQLCGLLKIMKVYSGDNPVSPDGFRLKNPKDWEMHHALHKDPYFSILQYLSWPCTTRCEFCLHKGDPPGYYTKSEYGWKTCPEEIQSRLRHWDPERRIGMPPKSEYNYFEIINHPDFLSLTKMVRGISGEYFNIVTNGNHLDRKVIHHLYTVRPVFLGISLNSYDKNVREELMRDPDPEIAIESLRYLKEKKIPYFISLVACDNDGLDDLVHTIQQVEIHDPYFIRIHLEAHTRYSPAWRSLKESNRMWKSIVEHIYERKETFRVPVFFQPAMVEEKYLKRLRNRVIVDGVIKYSPAWDAGIQAMDEILSIDDVPFAFKKEAREFLTYYQNNEIGEWTVKIKRKNRIINKTVQKTEKETRYPYDNRKFPVVAPYGLLLRGGIDHRLANNIIGLAMHREAKTVLVLTSYIVKSSLSELIGLFSEDLKDRIKIYLEVPKNREFLGGNIIIGDLLVADDFIRCIQDWRKRNHMDPDLVIVPGTPFNEWGRDLTNNTYMKIERITGLNIEIMHTDRIESVQ
jgi:hypothetical protein